MLSIAPKDRDFLRFYFPGSKGQEIYRHCRVVFGVCSSPYLLNISLIHLMENCPAEFREIAQIMKRPFYVNNLVCGVYNTSELEYFIEQAKCIMNKVFLICMVLKAMLNVEMLTSIPEVPQFWG
ncbi:DUF1758 domain-containing protein [Trichonephila clavata]|uniref:DUF1758 domain-containing protein n=1 Tax=Trichonephila clavata TaxID=2740835 RepID=A0A8X6KCE7_TRICU|nr:DUF1758 domain-containing protein [Trichonephila clavata]